jgi:type IV pilus assembly protein PilM
MAKQKEAIGLDIGSQFVKIVHLVQTSDKIEVKNYRIIEVQPAEDKAVAIKNALQSLQADVKDIPLICSVEGIHVFLRVFKLPGVAKSKLDRIINYEAQQQVPFPINEVAWSYQCLRKVSPEETDILLCAAKTSIVNEILKNVSRDVSNIIPPVTGLNTLLKYNNHEDLGAFSESAVMVLDIGAKTVNIIIKEKNSIWFRIVPIGSEVITQGLSSEYGIDISSAEIFKKEKGLILMEGEGDEDPDKKRISTTIIKSLARLSGEISRSIEVYSSNFNSPGPKKIYITGGGAYLKNISDFFNKKFRIETVVLRNIKNINVSASINKEKWNMELLKTQTAVGLALYGLEKKQEICLLPKEIIKKNISKYFWSYVNTAVGVLIFLGVCMSLYNYQIEKMFRANISKIESEVKSIDGNRLQMMNVQNNLDVVKSEVDVFCELKDARKYWHEMLLDIERNLPGNVWLVKVQSFLSQKEEKDKKSKEEEKIMIITTYADYMTKTIDLKITGKTTGTYQDVVIFNDALNKSKYFVKDSGKVASANPPDSGVRDFIIEIKSNLEGDS